MTVRLHPRETFTMVGGIVVHRGNPDFQDLRTAPSDVDSDHCQLGPELKTKLRHANFASCMLLRHCAKAIDLTYDAAECLHNALDNYALQALSCARRDFYWLLLARRGRADLPRVGDRQKPRTWKHFVRSAVDAIIEGYEKCNANVADYGTSLRFPLGRSCTTWSEG